MNEFNEISVYKGDYAANKVRWQNTPTWRVLKRARLYETMRVSYANMTGAVVSDGKLEKSLDPMPKPTRSSFPWRAMSVLLSIIVGVIVALFVCYLALAWVARAADAGDLSDEAFPAWVHPQGTNFFIDASYAKDSKADGWLGDARDELCGRLPSTTGTDDNDGGNLKETKSLPNGGLLVVCSPVHHDD